jgi:hypothetical protein
LLFCKHAHLLQVVTTYTVDVEWASRGDHLPFPIGVTPLIGTNKLLAEGFALPSVATLQGQATPRQLSFYCSCLYW